MTIEKNTLLDDLADVDQVEDITTDEEVDSSGSDVLADDADAVQDEENLNDDTDSDEDEDFDSDEEDEDEDSDEEDDDDSDEDEHASGRDAKIERRIAKKHAKMKLAEAEAEKLRDNLKTVTDRLEELEGSAGKVFSSPDEIAQRRSELRLEIDEIEDAIDEGEYTTSDGRTIDRKTLKQWRRAARRELEEALPAAERRLQRLDSVNRNVVAKAYPDILDPTSPDGKEASAILQRIPALKSDPEVYLLLGDMLRGKRLREKIPAKKKGKSSSRRAPESRSPSQATRSVRRPKSKSGSKQLLDDLAALEAV